MSKLSISPTVKKRLLLFFIIALALLFWTNPTIEEFKDHTTFNLKPTDYEENNKSDNYRQERVYVRSGYYLLFSIYEIRYRETLGTYGENTHKYIGIFNNFYKLR